MSTTDDRLTITLALTQAEIDALRWACQEQKQFCDNAAHLIGISDEGREVFNLRSRQLAMLSQLIYCMATDAEIAKVKC